MMRERKLAELVQKKEHFRHICFSNRPSAGESRITRAVICVLIDGAARFYGGEINPIRALIRN